jgi:hypothetical protein
MQTVVIFQGYYLSGVTLAPSLRTKGERERETKRGTGRRAREVLGQGQRE